MGQVLLFLGSMVGTVYGAKSGNDEDLPLPPLLARKMVIASSPDPNGATPTVLLTVSSLADHGKGRSDKKWYV